VGVEVQRHSFISFGKFRMTHWLLVIVIVGVISDESLTVTVYPSGCGEDEANIEANVYLALIYIYLTDTAPQEQIIGNYFVYT